MDEENQFCLRWSHYQHQLGEALRMLLQREMLVDVTLACDGRSLRAHRAVLSACSSYFQGLFQESPHSHPIVILKDVKFEELESLVHFMYNGEVTVGNDSLPGFLNTAKTLQIKGLTTGPDDSAESSKYNSAISDGLSNDSDGREQKTDTESVNTTNAVNYCDSKRIKTEHSVTDNLVDDILNHEDTHLSVLQTVDDMSQSLPPAHADETGSPRQFAPNHNHGLLQSLLPHHHSSAGFSPRPFRHRVLWSQEQLARLESWYAADRYPSGQTMHQYAEALAGLNPNAYSPTRQNVDYWFQNRRRRDSHPEVMQQREKKKMARTLWGQIMDQRMTQT